MYWTSWRHGEKIDQTYEHLVLSRQVAALRTNQPTESKGCKIMCDKRGEAGTGSGTKTTNGHLSRVCGECLSLCFMYFELEGLAALTLTWLHALLQVIYKKTQLPCPLPFFYHHSANLSMNASDPLGLPGPLNSLDFSPADVSPAVLDHDAPLAAAVHFEPQATDEEMCTPKYFVFNSQVRYQGKPLRTWSTILRCL